MTIGKNRARWHCAPCGKVSYGSQKRAEETAHTMQVIYDGNHKVPTRAYECEFGNGWHLTSKAERSYQ